MITVNFGKISKRKNSTLQPTVSAAFSVALKENCSIENPTFQLTAGSFDYNYAKWGDRYYWIDNVISTRNNGWEVQCSLDYMATYKAAILATSAYVEYSSSGGYSDMMDSRVAVRTGGTVGTAIADVGFNEYGHYLLAAVGESGVTLWELSNYSQLMGVLSSIGQWSDNILNGATDTLSAIQVSFSQLISQGSAVDCIRDCRWMPFAASGGVGGFVSLGRYNTGVAAGSVNPARPFVAGEVDIAVPFSRAGFLRCPPYTEVMLYLPYVGNVNISSTLFTNSNYVHVDYSMDYRSGGVAYLVSIGGVYVGAFGGDSSVTIPVGVSNISPLALLSNIAQTVGAVTHGSASGRFAGAADSLAAMGAIPSSTGGLSGGAASGLPRQAVLKIVEHPVSGAVGNMNTTQGLPLYAHRTLSALTGYVQTRGASVQASAEGAILDRINATLDSGAFLE